MTQCAADVHSPDVILIKDEDDVGACEPVVGESFSFSFFFFSNLVFV